MLTIFIAWMVVNAGLVAFVLVHPPRHFTSNERDEDVRHDVALDEKARTEPQSVA